MHKLAKEIMDRVKSKINACGIDGITEQELIEMKYWTCVADAMTSYDYHFKIIEEMEKPENQYGVNYDENGRFYTPSRNSMGRYTRGYEHDPMMRQDMEHYRDMDRHDGRMYYTDSNMSGNSHRMSQYDRARRGYEESKEMNPESDNMEKLREIFDALEKDMNELKPMMQTSEKNFVKSRFNTMSNSMM